MEPIDLLASVNPAGEEEFVFMMGMESPTTRLLDLPDEILQMCLARLPLECISRMIVVCKRWRKLGDVQNLRRIRKKLGVMQTYTFVIDNEYMEGQYQGLQGRATVSHDQSESKTYPIATLHGPQRLQFGAAGSDGLVYILGGRSPFMCPMSAAKAWIVYARVDVYEPLSNSWCEIQPMQVARYGFAAGALVDLDTGELKIIVAGGYDAEGEALSSVEVHDLRKGHWEAIPSMSNICGPCKGEVLEGSFYVQQANGGSDTIEVYDSARCQWGRYNPKLSKFCPKSSTEKNGTCKSIVLEL